MMAARRERETGGFELPLPIGEAFKLFTAEGERLWVPGWAPEVLGPLPQAAGLVFLTGVGAERTIWTVIESDHGGHVVYSRVTPGSRAGLVEVRLSLLGERTRVDVSYDLTALSDEGESALDAYAGEAFAEMLATWERLIAAFLETPGARARLAESVV